MYAIQAVKWFNSFAYQKEVIREHTVVRKLYRVVPRKLSSVSTSYTKWQGIPDLLHLTAGSNTHLLTIEGEAKMKQRNYGDKADLANNLAVLDYSNSLFVVFLRL